MWDTSASGLPAVAGSAFALGIHTCPRKPCCCREAKGLECPGAQSTSQEMKSTESCCCVHARQRSWCHTRLVEMTHHLHERASSRYGKNLQETLTSIKRRLPYAKPLLTKSCLFTNTMNTDVATFPVNAQASLPSLPPIFPRAPPSAPLLLYIHPFKLTIDNLGPFK